MDVFRKLVPGYLTKTDSSPTNIKQIPSIRMNIRNFIFIRTLGTGSFGRVFLAKQKNDLLLPPVAIKRLKKYVVVKQKQVDHILSEKNILARLSHPFIINMYGTFKDDRYLYIVMEYVNGGEFFTHLRKVKQFENESVKFYAAQIIQIFDYLHELNIIYRDLKPENILVAKDGYLKLADFGFAKEIYLRTYTLCGTPEYIAPEVLLNKGHGKPVDWWTLGILIYEMAVGYPPFFDEDPYSIYQKILGGQIIFPKYFDKNSKALVKKLLTADLTRRYGNLRGGINDIKQHPWFENFDWEAQKKKTLTPPFKPRVRNPDDSSNFDEYPESIDQPLPVVDDLDPFTDW